MGEWGKWWSSRGADQNVKCTFCGRNVPKHKAVQVNNSGRLGRDIYELAEVVSMGGVKGYACLSCAKHRHLVKDGIHTTEKDKAMKKRTREKREMEKVMDKVREMEKMDGSKPASAPGSRKFDHGSKKPFEKKDYYPKANAPKAVVPMAIAPKPVVPKAAAPMAVAPKAGGSPVVNLGAGSRSEPCVEAPKPVPKVPEQAPVVEPKE